MARWKVAVSAVTFGRCSDIPLRRLEEEGCDVVLNPYNRPLTASELAEFASDADALVLGNDVLPEKVVRRFTKMKVVARYGVGLDTIDMFALRKEGIPLTYAPSSNHEETADFTFGLILDLARNITPMINTTKAGGWNKTPGFGLYGKTIGIIGVGAVGTAVARRAMGFSMDVIGCDIVQRSDATLYGLIYTPLNDLLRRSDIVTLHVPLTDSTRNLIGARELRMMKRTSILINTARSACVWHDALDRALRDGRLAGYATDVYDEEPPKPQPYFDYPNVLLTPHTAGHTVESNIRLGNVVADNIIAVKNGETPPDLVTTELFTSLL